MLSIQCHKDAIFLLTMNFLIWVCHYLKNAKSFYRDFNMEAQHLAFRIFLFVIFIPFLVRLALVKIDCSRIAYQSKMFLPSVHEFFIVLNAKCFSDFQRLLFRWILTETKGQNYTAHEIATFREIWFSVGHKTMTYELHKLLRNTAWLTSWLEISAERVTKSFMHFFQGYVSVYILNLSVLL